MSSLNYGFLSLVYWRRTDTLYTSLRRIFTRKHDSYVVRTLEQELDPVSYCLFSCEVLEKNTIQATPDPLRVAVMGGKRLVEEKTPTNDDAGNSGSRSWTGAYDCDLP